MADDLDDEWWLSDTRDSVKDVSDNSPLQENKKVKSKTKKDTLLPEKQTPKHKLSVTEDSPPKKKRKSKTAKSSNDSTIEKISTSPAMKEDDDSERLTSTVDDNGESEVKKKKRKRKKISEELAKKKQRPAKYKELTSAIKKHLHSKLSPVEIDEVTLQKDNFTAPRDPKTPAVDHLALVTPHWSKQVKLLTDSPGAPLVLIVCSAATRAVDLIRELRPLHKGKCKFTKLFAKHMKITEQSAFLKKSVVHVGVGTPNRINALLQDSLSLSKLTVVVLDWTWRDAKLRRLIDIPEIRNDLFSLLQRHLIPAVKDRPIKFSLL